MKLNLETPATKFATSASNSLSIVSKLSPVSSTTSWRIPATTVSMAYKKISSYNVQIQLEDLNNTVRITFNINYKRTKNLTRYM